MIRPARYLTVRRTAMAACTLIASGCTLPAAALTFGSGTYGSCTFDSCSITISSSGVVSSDVTPASGNTCTIQQDSVSVATSDSSGFTLSLAGGNTDMSLTQGADTIPASSGTQSSPATLSAGMWGYRVDTIGGFGAGPTTAQSNSGASSLLFAGVPTSSDPADTIATTSVAANPAVVTPVWYGVCADTSVPSGTYTNQVVYTAVTN